MSLGTWRLSDNVIKYLKENLDENSSIIEFGSGDGTNILSKHFKMYSIENDEEWIDKYDSTYLNVPLTKYTKETFPEGYSFFGENDLWWYNPDELKKQLEEKVDEYDMLVVDGPKGYRGGMLDCIELFNTDKPILFDDVHDEWHMALAEMIAKKIGAKLEIFKREDGQPEFVIVKK